MRKYISKGKKKNKEEWVDGKYDKKPNRSGKTVRKENLPDWAKKDYVQPKETMLSKEIQDEMKERLARIHAKREENRIDGTEKFGRAWMIPKDAEKPVDGRMKTRNKQEENHGI